MRCLLYIQLIFTICQCYCVDWRRSQIDSDLHGTSCYLKQPHLEALKMLLASFSNILPLSYLTEQTRLYFWHLMHYSDNSVLETPSAEPYQFVTLASKYCFDSHKVCAKYAAWQTSSKTVVEFLVVFRTFYMYLFWFQLYICICCSIWYNKLWWRLVSKPLQLHKGSVFHTAI